MYIFRYNGSSWINIDSKSSSYIGGNFGFSVNLNGDASILAVGEPFIDGKNWNTFVETGGEGEGEGEGEGIVGGEGEGEGGIGEGEGEGEVDENLEIGGISIFNWTITSDDNANIATTPRFAGNGWASSENETVRITTNGYKFAYIDDKPFIFYSRYRYHSKTINFNSISSRSNGFIETSLAKIVDDNGYDLGNGVTINIRIS